jgi:formylglycine-generating enzyme required for sulfatase activity
LSDENELIGTNHVGDMIVDKHLMTASRAKAMKSGFSYSLPTLGLLSILMLPLAGHADTKKPGAVFKDCDTCPEMVVIPAGSFKMGDLSGKGGSNEKPVHEVKIGYSFAVGKYEVTQAEWEAVMGKNPSKYKGARKPVHKVSWEDAKSFIKKLSEQTGKEYRLLSESEWEYMARAGSATEYPWGDEIDSSKAKYDSEDGPVPVGSYSANAFGVHDTAGNVQEWVEDCAPGPFSPGKHKYYKDAPIDGSAWLSASDCEGRVFRGGSYNVSPYGLRSAIRGRDYASERHNIVGFRIARTLSQ